MQRDLQIISDRKLRDEVAETMFEEHKRRNAGYGNKMLSDYSVNREYWETLADIAIERINRCLI